MELMFREGDYVLDEAAGLRRVQGKEELLQRVLFRLRARRGMFPLMETLGSRLWKLSQLPASSRPVAAKQYVAEALEEETDLEVEGVTLLEDSGELTVRLLYQGEHLSVTLKIQ